MVTKHEMRLQKLQEKKEQKSANSKARVTKPKAKLWIFFIVIFIIVISVFAFSRLNGSSNQYDEVAKCLTKEGFVMYGADWCHNCLQQKKDFGDSFKYINYVECTQQPDKCQEDGIEGYPTWTLPDGTKLIGYQKIDALLSRSQCVLV